MPFDAQLPSPRSTSTASAPDHPDLSVLRARYPELGFVFDRLEDQVQELSDTVDKQIEDRGEATRSTALNEQTSTSSRSATAACAWRSTRSASCTVDAEITNIIEDAL